MTFILSGCLILLKLAMAVNDGLHTMLSNVYSVLETAMQSDQGTESVEESSSAPGFQRSKSQILDAFNRRRWQQSPAMYDQTDVLVSNLTPFQEITITNKDVEGRRKQTVSPTKKPVCKWTVGPNADAEINVEKECARPSSSESYSTSYVSLEDLPYQSSGKVDESTQVQDANNDFHQETAVDEPKMTLEKPPGDVLQFSRNISLSSSEDAHFLNSLQERIRLASQHFRTASQSCLNSKKRSTDNISALTKSHSTENGEKESEVKSNFPTLSAEDAISTKMLMAETTRLYEQFLNNYYTCKDSSTDLGNTPKNSLKTTLEDNLDKSAKAPVLFKKDSWANMDEIVEFINLRSLQKLSEVSTENIESSIVPHLEDSFTDSDSDNHVQPKEELFPFLNSFGTVNDSFEVTNKSQYSINLNLSCRPLLVCEEMDDSGDLEVLSLARVDDLTKVLREVGATEVLGEPNGFKKDMSKILNDISDTGHDIGIPSATETKFASASNGKILNFDNIPLKDLDTEEKQINYLNNVADGYLKEIKNGNISLNNVISDDFDQRHKIILETITSVYKKKLDFVTLSSGKSQSLLLSTDGVPFTSRKDRCNNCVSPRTSTNEELDAFGLPFFVKTTNDDLFYVDKDHSETSFAIDCNETSTPKRDEMLQEQNWISINLSSESRKEFEVTRDEKSCPYIKESQSSDFNDKDVNASLVYNGMKWENEYVRSVNASNVKGGNTLEAKDWGDLAAEMHKSYLECLSILNIMCVDEAEDSSPEANSNCNGSDESDNGKSDEEKTETLCESKDDLIEGSNCNKVSLRNSENANLVTSEDVIEPTSTGNIVEIENHESDIMLKKLDCNFSSSNNQNIFKSELQSEELSCRDKELHDSSKSDNALKCGSSVIEKCHLNSENPIDKAEFNITDQAKLDVKSEITSHAEDVIQNLSSDAVHLEQLQSSTKTTFVKDSSDELPMKTNIYKKDLLNKEFLSNNFDKEVELYLKCVEDINNVKEIKTGMIHPVEDQWNYEFEFEDQKINSLRISKKSIETTPSHSTKSTPISNIDALQEREELETSQIYDNEDISDHETLIAAHSDSMFSGDIQQNGFKVEADVPNVLIGNKTLVSYIKMNNTPTVENSLVIVSDELIEEDGDVVNVEATD